VAFRLLSYSRRIVNISLVETLILIKKVVLVSYISVSNVLPKLLVETDIYLMHLNYAITETTIRRALVILVSKKKI
jgi:hypothetical protein